MKLLLVTPLSPNETGNGGAVRTRLLYESLCEVADVRVSVIDTWGARPHDADVVPLESIREVPPTEDPGQRFRGKMRLRRFLKTAWENHFRKPGDSERILARLGWPGERFDAVVCRFAWIAYQTEAWKIAPLYIDIDDLPIEDFRSLQKPHFSRRRAFLFDWLIRLEQNFTFRRAVGTWIPNREHLEEVRRFSVCAHLPNTVRSVTPGYDEGLPRARRLATVAALTYSANIHGIDWFLREVWPAFHAAEPDVEYVIAGRCPDPGVIRRWNAVEGVRAVGFVDDLDAFYAECLGAVAPVFLGGGTAVKVIEAAMHGRRTFATPFAARGLSDDEKRQLGIAEFSDAAAFVRSFREWTVVTDAARTDSERKMHEFADANFSPQRFRAVVQQLLTCRRDAGACAAGGADE